MSQFWLISREDLVVSDPRGGGQHLFAPILLIMYCILGLHVLTCMLMLSVDLNEHVVWSPRAFLAEITQIK